MAWKLISARCTGEAAALDQVGHVAAQIGVDDLRASDAHHLGHLVLRQVADLENAGLGSLDQKHRLVLDLGLHRGAHADFENALGHRCGVDAKLNVNRRRFLFQQDGWRIGLLQRCLLEVDTLNLENGGLLICHIGLSGQNKARCWNSEAGT